MPWRGIGLERDICMYIYDSLLANDVDQLWITKQLTPTLATAAIDTDHVVAII